ncbi:thiocillin family RiPP [Streptomyces sp. NBC_01278]|uniref:thiocillin family RiPP n=1 Tax=Streptomyces sp. NBC_01278 TaxID=2903809 RepID=UPI002E30720B|nr:thiocillin family RiPP [Streptomyces sp. NBC_01278]
MEHINENDLQLFLSDELVVEDLPETAALGSWGSAGTFGSTVGGCASTVSTGSTFT